MIATKITRRGSSLLAWAPVIAMMKLLLTIVLGAFIGLTNMPAGPYAPKTGQTALTAFPRRLSEVLPGAARPFATWWAKEPSTVQVAPSQCEEYFILDGRDPVNLPDTWAEARVAFEEICHSDSESPDDCQAMTAVIFEGRPRGAEVFYTDSALCGLMLKQLNAGTKSDGSFVAPKPRRMKGSGGSGGDPVVAGAVGGSIGGCFCCMCCFFCIRECRKKRKPVEIPTAPEASEAPGFNDVILHIDDRVQTLYSVEEGGDGQWYCGTIKMCYENGHVLVDYDDGDQWCGLGLEVHLLTPPSENVIHAVVLGAVVQGTVYGGEKPKHEDNLLPGSVCETQLRETE